MSNGQSNGHAPSPAEQRRSNAATDNRHIPPAQSNGQSNGHNGHAGATDTTSPSREGVVAVPTPTGAHHMTARSHTRSARRARRRRRLAQLRRMAR